MASQDYTPQFIDDATQNRQYRETLVCRLLPFDQKSANALTDELHIAPGSTHIFGRNKDCTHKLNDSYISGTHCKIWHSLEDNELWIKDYSSNGTFIDGRRIGRGSTTTLVDGNRISFSRPELGYLVESYLDLNEEELLADKYHFRGELGRGAFSVVKKAISVLDGNLCAIKVINKAKLLSDPKSRDQVMREIEILKKVNHPNVIKYLDCVDTVSKMYIVLEYADGGELFDHIVAKGAFPENQAKEIFLQMLQGVAYLHSQNIAHRDLKPENILVHSGIIKITDFGLAKLSQNKASMRTLCGTPQYVAPEIIKMASSSNPDNGEGYTTAVDMWSLGVILFLLLTGRPPFSAEVNRDLSLYSQIETVSYGFHMEQDPKVSESARDLISKLLKAEPFERLSAMEALEHPWLTSAIASQIAGTPPSSQSSLTQSKKRKADSVPGVWEDNEALEDSDEDKFSSNGSTKKRKLE